MTNEEIRVYLEEHAEREFQAFTAGLIPDSDPILGVRIPVLRALAKQIAKEGWRSYLDGARDDSYEEILLQGYVIGYAKAPVEEALSRAAVFFPKIHDWSVCDGFCSTFRIARTHRERVWEFLMTYCGSPREFEQRAVAVMLMSHFLVGEYLDRVLAVWDRLKHEGYYCRKGIAWGIATAYAKFPERTEAYLRAARLDDFTYNKAIQKMLESRRIPAEDKERLRRMKRRKEKSKNPL